MEWKSAEIKDGGCIKIPERWLHLYYYEALNILFRFENALRLFVYIVLKKNLGKDWDVAALGDGITIRTETKKRIAQARENGYLGYEVSSPMLYLSSGELTQIISSDAYWKHFAPFFKATKAIVLTKLQEIGTVRNSLAHFRPIKQDDIDLIKQNSRHLLVEIENCLVQITSITDLVPSNSEEPWYTEIKPIGNENLSTTLFLSRDQQWIRLELTYKVPTLRRDLYGDRYVSFKVGNIRTPQLLKLYSAIREHCIYVSESPIYGRLNADLSIASDKSISVVFSCEILEGALDNIIAELKSLAVVVQEETSLIERDHLARGQLIESQSGNAFHKERDDNSTYWQVDLDALKTSIADIDEIEYWGQRSHFADDFISSTSHYPWMPSSVSSEEWPF